MGGFVSNPLAQANMNAIAQLSTPPGQSPGPGQSSSDQMPISPEGYMRSLMQMHNMHAMKQQVGLQTLGTYDQQTKAGMYIDPKAWQKAYKQAGIKIDTTKEGVEHAANFFKQYAGQKDPASGEQQQLPPEIAGMMEKAKAGQLSKKDVQKFVTTAAIRSEMRSDRIARADKLTQEAFAREAQKQQSIYLDDNAGVTDRWKAAGKLGMLLPDTMGHLVGSLRDSLIETPEQRQKALGIAAGQETDAQKNERIDRLMDQGLSMNLSAQDARQWAQEVASGAPLTVKMPQMTPQQSRTYLEGVDAAVKLGATGNYVRTFAQLYTMRGPDAAMGTLPTGVKTLEEQKMALEERKTRAAESSADSERMQAQASVERASADATEAATRAAQEQFLETHSTEKLNAEQTKLLVDNFRTMAEIQKLDPKLPPDVMNNMYASVAERLGMKKEPVEHLFGLYTKEEWTDAKSTKDYVGDPGDAGKPNAAALSNAATAPGKSTMDQIGDAAATRRLAY